MHTEQMETTRDIGIITSSPNVLDSRRGVLDNLDSVMQKEGVQRLKNNLIGELEKLSEQIGEDTRACGILGGAIRWLKDEARGLCTPLVCKSFKDVYEMFFHHLSLLHEHAQGYHDKKDHKFPIILDFIRDKITHMMSLGIWEQLEVHGNLAGNINDGVFVTN